MRFAFSPDQLALRDAFREALARECPPQKVRESWTRRVPELWRTLADLGALGVNAPEDAGGMGLGPLEWVLLLEEAGRVALPCPLLEAVAAVPLLAERGRGDVVRRVVAGDATLTAFLAGTWARDADEAEVVLEVTRDGTASEVADPVLVAQASVDGSRRLFRVEGRMIPLGRDAGLLDRAALACSAELLGVARKALDLAVEHARVRHQFGRPIGSFQAVQHHLADALLAIEFAAPAVYRAAWSLATADPAAGTHVSMAKAYASDAADLAVKTAIQVHGAIGYTTECDLHLWAKRAFALRASWGDAAFHRARVADALLGAAHA